jgi:hypothetical protein
MQLTVINLRSVDNTSWLGIVYQLIENVKNRHCL